VIVQNDTRQVILPTRDPTIIAIHSGPWHDPNNWEPARVPNASDIALVPTGTTVTLADGSPNPIVMTGLINQGTILLSCQLGVPVALEIGEFIHNSGLMRGRDGQGVGEPGCAITVQTNELVNPGTLRGGDGMNGA